LELITNDELTTTTEEINICYNCEKYNRIGQFCSEKEAQTHETQTCNLFDLKAETNLKTKREIKDEHEISVIRHQIYTLLIERKRNEATELIVKEFTNKNIIKVTRDDNKPEFYIYHKGIYIPEGRTYIEEYCRAVLSNAYNTNLLNEVISKIQADYKVGFDDFLNTNYEYELPVQNGILCLKTLSLKQFTPDKYFFNKLPIVYDPDAKCPKINKFLTEITVNNTNLLYEIFGFSLVKKMFLETTFMFVGDGSNGKSQLLELFKRFIGVNNTCSVTLQQMKSEDSGLRELHNKMLNLAGDVDSTALKNTGIFKELSGGDLIQAKRKFKRDITFQNFAKMIFACNDLPRVYDNSKGFWRRWILINFPYEFIDQKQYEVLTVEEKKNKRIKKPRVIENILSETELSGLLNESLKGLKNVFFNKSFTYSKNADEVKTVWLRKADSFMAFCQDHIVESFGNKILKKDIKSNYLIYRKKHRLRSVSDKAIKRILEDEYSVSEVFIDGYSYWEDVDFKL